MSTKPTRAAFEFFREHAGYCVGRRALGAWQLAKAEAEALSRGITFQWDHDQDSDHSWCDIKEEHEHEVLYCVARDAQGRVLASLSGIYDADRNYGRVVEAELALEAIS